MCLVCVLWSCQWSLCWGGVTTLPYADLVASLFSYLVYALLGNKETFLVNQTVIRFLEMEGDKEQNVKLPQRSQR